MKLWDRFRDWLLPPEPVDVATWVPPALSDAALAAPIGLHTNGHGPPASLAGAVSLTAAAKPDPGATTPPGRMPLTQMPPLPNMWEDRAWAAYRHLGAARQAVDWLAHNASRCHLYIGEFSEDGTGDPDPVDDPGIMGEVLAELHAGPIGQPAMLKRMARHILVCGATWLAGYPAPPEPDEPATPATPNTMTSDPAKAAEKEPPRTQWTVLSRKEWMDGENGGIRLKLPEHPNRGPDHWVTFDPDDDVVLIPIYEPDSEDASYATSAFEAALADTDELNGLSRRVAADIKSRLIGGGLALIAESATMPNPAASGGVNPLNADPFITTLMAAGRTAIQNPDSPEASMPIFGKVSDEAFNGKGPIVHQTFATPFDEQIPVLRQDARKTLAADLDIPAEIVTGVGDIQHWGQWAVTDDAIRSHLGPLMTVIVVGLTLKIVRPASRAAGETNVDKRCVWWSASEITQRPDRSEVTLKAHQLGIIGDKAARRELGFTEEDAPDPAEQQAAADRAAQQASEQDQGSSAQQAGQPAGTGSRQQPEQGGQPRPGNTPNPPQRPGTTNKPSPPEKQPSAA